MVDEENMENFKIIFNDNSEKNFIDKIDSETNKSQQKASGYFFLYL